MDKYKLKNLIIVLLLLVNAFLLELYIANAYHQNQAEDARTQALAVILKKQGIAIGEDVELPDSGGKIVELRRSLSSEKKMLSKLIGSCNYSDQGGDIYLFSGTKGKATISGGGETKIVLYSDRYFDDGALKSETKAVLKKLGIEYDENSMELTREDKTDCVTVTCTYKGEAVLNAKLSFYFSEGYLRSVTGRRPPDDKVSAAKVENDFDAVTVIMAFLESINQSGEVCSQITNINTACVLESATVGANTLTPVWCIETDAKTYYVDGSTCKVRTLESQ